MQSMKSASHQPVADQTTNEKTARLFYMTKIWLKWQLWLSVAEQIEILILGSVIYHVVDQLPHTLSILWRHCCWTRTYSFRVGNLFPCRIPNLPTHVCVFHYWVRLLHIVLCKDAGHYLCLCVCVVMETECGRLSSRPHCFMSIWAVTSIQGNKEQYSSC